MFLSSIIQNYRFFVLERLNFKKEEKKNNCAVVKYATVLLNSFFFFASSMIKISLLAERFCSQVNRSRSTKARAFRLFFLSRTNAFCYHRLIFQMHYLKKTNTFNVLSVSNILLAFSVSTFLFGSAQSLVSCYLTLTTGMCSRVCESKKAFGAAASWFYSTIFYCLNMRLFM